MLFRSADGTTLSYVPSDMSAVRSRIPADAPHLRLLLGDSDLLASFAASEVQLKQAAYPGSRQLRLVPRTPQPGIEVVYLEIGPDGGIARVLVVDGMGNESDLVLEKVNENASVRSDVFDVRLPPGIHLRDASGSAPQ